MAEYRNFCELRVRENDPYFYISAVFFLTRIAVEEFGMGNQCLWIDGLLSDFRSVSKIYYDN